MSIRGARITASHPFNRKSNPQDANTMSTTPLLERAQVHKYPCLPVFPPWRESVVRLMPSATFADARQDLVRRKPATL
jgi:hypothetical protein